MGHRNLLQLCVYVDEASAKVIRRAAAAEKSNISVFIKSAIDNKLRAASDKDGVGSRVRYLTVGVDAILDHLDIKLRPAVRKINDAKFGGSSDAQ